MIKKVLANILLNIAIFTIAFSIIWAFKNNLYFYAVGAILAMAMCIFLKIRIIKSVRKLTRKNE
ncbi:MAG: hypothetical protein H7096_10800 [Flavobacterium sp.]|nr:hypothetical protein [Pedobacter sp.]